MVSDQKLLCNFKRFKYTVLTSFVNFKLHEICDEIPPKLKSHNIN